jgi:uncharacterized membrane protein
LNGNHMVLLLNQKPQLSMFDTSHLHPMIVHFPIALIIAGFFADIAYLFFRSEKCLSKTGLYLMVLGTIAAIAAWLTGQLFTNEPEQGSVMKVFTQHETAALITMILMIAGSALRIWVVIRKKEETNLKWVVFGIYLLGVAAVSFTGFMGGSMVYNYMMSL